MDLDYENAPLDPPEEEKVDGLPQTIQLNPDAIINQLMRRYGGQLQQQTWENTLLAAENEQLKTLLTEAQAEQAEAQSTIVEMARENDALIEHRDALIEHIALLDSRPPEMGISPVDDPQPVEDGFLAMAAGQPGLASAPSPADT